MPTKDVQEHFRSNLIFALDETFEGPASHGSVYLDSNAGFRQSLAELSVKEATTSAWPGATTVAAQVNHTRYYLDILMRFARGEVPERDWDGNWAEQISTEEEWQELQEGLFESYGLVRESLLQESQPDDDFSGAMQAILAHSAYHLGAVRQLLQALRQART